MSKNVWAGILAIVGIIFASTVGEFVTALINRYSTYPSGTDTSMLATSFFVGLVFLFLTFVPIFWLVAKQSVKSFWLAILAVFILGLFVWWFELIPSFVPPSWCKYELKIYPCPNDIWNQ